MGAGAARRRGGRGPRRRRRGAGGLRPARRRCRGDRAGRELRRPGARGLPRPRHQRRHLARRGRPGGARAGRRRHQRRVGRARPRAGRRRRRARRRGDLHPRRRAQPAHRPIPGRSTTTWWPPASRPPSRWPSGRWAAGVDPHSVVIDPAHDFAKNTFHSLEITRRIGEMVDTGYPVLVSVSNKDFVGETLGLPTGERRNGTYAATAICAMAGAPDPPGPPGPRDPAAGRHGLVDRRPPPAATRDPGAGVRAVLVPGVLALLPEYAGLQTPSRSCERPAWPLSGGLRGPAGERGRDGAGAEGRGGVGG